MIAHINLSVALFALLFNVALGGKTNGVQCRRDIQCASGYCSKQWDIFWSQGVCSECKTDDDCEGRGISRPGELPKAFCHQGGGNTVQQKFCSHWKRGKPIDDGGYPLHSSSKSGKDGPDRIRRFIYEDDGPAMSQVWHWDLNNQPEGTIVEVNETHVSIPLYKQTLAGYSRTYHVFEEEHETGIVTAVFLNNPYSVITTKAHSAMVEKYHTLTYDGEMPTPKADRVTKELENRPNIVQQKAEQRYKVRSYGLMSALIPTRVVDSLIEAGQDQVHLEHLRSYVKERLLQGEGGETNDDDWLPNSSNEAKEALEYAKSKKSMKSESHCKHFEDGYGIVVTDTHIEIPLNSPWVALSGETQISPDYYLGLNNGIKIAKYDKESNSLEFHYKAYQQYRYYIDRSSEEEASSTIQSGLWVAPISSDYPVLKDDGRSDQYYRSEPYWFQAMLTAGYHNIPVDYSIYDRGSAVCTEEVLETLSDQWQDAKLEEAEVQDTDNVFEDILGMHSLMQVLVDGAACSNFLKSDYGPNTTGFDTLSFTVWAHFILEFDPHATEEMATAQFWDDWDAFYKK